MMRMSIIYIYIQYVYYCSLLSAVLLHSTVMMISFFSLDSENIQQLMELVSIPVWGGVCVFIHGICLLVSPALLKEFRNQKQDVLHEWCNKATSSFHAIVLFSLTFNYWYCLDIEIRTYVGDYEKMCLKMMLGYLLYDCAHEIMLSITISRSTMFHHILGFLSLALILYYDCGVGAYFSMFIFLAELSTPFLHFSWLLNTLHMTNTLIFKVTAGSLLILFFICRVLLGPRLLHEMITSFDLWVDRFPGLFQLNVVIVTLFTLLNFYWFFLLLRLALGKMRKKKNN